MNSTELRDFFRSQTTDTVTPYLWSDDEVYTYMNDAYFMFVRLVGGISDALSDACVLDALEGEAYSDLSPSILRVRQATLAPDGQTIRVINAQDVESLSDEDFGILRRLNTSTSVGAIRYMVIGLQQDVVRWVNIPDQAYTVNLVVERLPLTPIQGPGQRLTDVPAHHHMHLLTWMKSLAYNKQDADTFDAKKADAFAAEFTTYCELAKREKERYKHKVRVVKYGGI